MSCPAINSFRHLLDQLVDGALVPDRVEKVADEVLRGVEVQQLAHHHGRLLRGHLLHVHLRSARSGRSRGHTHTHVTKTKKERNAGWDERLIQQRSFSAAATFLERYLYTIIQKPITAGGPPCPSPERQTTHVCVRASVVVRSAQKPRLKYEVADPFRQATGGRGPADREKGLQACVQLHSYRVVLAAETIKSTPTNQATGGRQTGQRASILTSMYFWRLLL